MSRSYLNLDLCTITIFWKEPARELRLWRSKISRTVSLTVEGHVWQEEIQGENESWVKQSQWILVYSDLLHVLQVRTKGSLMEKYDVKI